MVGSFSAVLITTLACCLLHAATARPAEDHGQEDFIMEIPVETQIITLKPGKEAKPTEEPKRDSTRDIIEKIKLINQNLKKPYRKHFYSYQNHQLPVETRDISSNTEQENYEPMENTRDIIEKIKIINENLGKQNNKHYYNHPPQPTTDYIAQREDNFLQMYGRGLAEQLRKNDKNIKTSEIEENLGGNRNKRSNMLTPFPYTLKNIITKGDYEHLVHNLPNDEGPMITLPNYLLIPISLNNLYRNDRPLLRQYPSLPISLPSIPWPLAQYFPIIIKDPLLALVHGGGLNNIIEYGQAADVCNRGNSKTDKVKNYEDDQDNSIAIETNDSVLRRSARAVKLESATKEGKRSYVPKKNKKTSKSNNKKPTRVSLQDNASSSTSNLNDKDDDDSGDLRFTEFGLFGNKRPVAPSPGFFINRLKVRRGGVAIAGPGGVATAGRGGTAIVGPGGLAYTQPGGLAIAGPSAKVVALSADTDLNDIIAQIHNQQNIEKSNESIARRLKAAPGGKVVATGPVVYYHEYEDPL